MRYQLSLEAQADIENVYKYGLKSFGTLEANDYLNGLYSKLDSIAASPTAHPISPLIGKPYRMAVYRVNSVYFRIDDISNVIKIVRILSRQDPMTAMG